jgi:hypothetical protein
MLILAKLRWFFGRFKDSVEKQKPKMRIVGEEKYGPLTLLPFLSWCCCYCLHGLVSWINLMDDAVYNHQRMQLHLTLNISPMNWTTTKTA